MGTEKTSPKSNATLIGEVSGKDSFLFLSLENAELKGKIAAMYAKIKTARDFRENYQEIVNERNAAFVQIEELKADYSKLESELQIANTHIENLERYLLAFDTQAVRDEQDSN